MFVGFRVPVFVFLYVTVMSSITVEQLETILENKLEKALTPLSKQVQDAMDSIKFINAKYDEISKSLKAFDEEKKILMNENKLLKTEFLKTANELKTLKVSFNDLDQYSRRDCLEIRGIPTSTALEVTSDIVMQVGEKIGVILQRDDISVSHRIPSKSANQGKKSWPDAIIVKFVRRDTRETFYRARKELKNVTTEALGYSETNKIFINESLTQKNKDLFNDCLQFKKDHSYKFIWTYGGKIFLRKDVDSSPVHIKNVIDLQKL